MNYVAAAIAEHYSGNDKSKDILQHIGVKFRSGRYPYGSGDNPYQHEKRHKLRRNDVIPGDEGTDFLDRVLNLREKKDFTWTDDDGIWGQGKERYLQAILRSLTTWAFQPGSSERQSPLQKKK